VTITADGEEVPMRPGDALCVAPETTRQVKNRREWSLFVISGAP
jgi:mannose-6-phosphate isomerase-like protein (cupin superfamily)